MSGAVGCSLLDSQVVVIVVMLLEFFCGTSEFVPCMLVLGFEFWLWVHLLLVGRLVGLAVCFG